MLLIACIACLGFAASCGDNGGEQTTNNSSTSQITQATQETEASHTVDDTQETETAEVGKTTNAEETTKITEALENTETTEATAPKGTEHTTEATDPEETEQTTEAAQTTEVEQTAECNHSWAEATCTQPRTCAVCQATEGEPTGAHTGGTATCTSKAVCEVCGNEYGKLLNHKYDTFIIEDKYLYTPATMDKKAQYFKACSGCGKAGLIPYEYGETLLEVMKKEYAEIDPAQSNVEKFMFFTDPHYVTAEINGTWREGALEQLDIMAAQYGIMHPSFVVCGGDWLNDTNSRDNAKQMLGAIREKMDELFGTAYLMVGNHDYNYQVIIDGKTVQSEEELTPKELADALFPQYGKTYYSFEGENTTFYVVDTGKDWGHQKLFDYDVEQAQWFLECLAQNDDAHIAILPHMFYIYNKEDTKNPLVELMSQISSVYNMRGVFEYNGETYDFREKNGKVEFILAGHSHRDETGSINGIPFVLTRIAKSSKPLGTPAFDFILVDYDEKKMELIRIGEGEYRCISLVQ